ncbi:Flp pilus assembly protein CpaB [Mycetocola sp. 2940]|uniref:Flp pilus assembly protein CpaB n=1 Tax=Mycetocola sp. 2940 TaxID=3156452 RepID=UPI003399BF40
MKTRLIGAILAVVLAVIGTVVLTGYVRTADARASAGAEMVSVYVVKEAIPAGTKAEDAVANFEVKEIPALAAVKGRVTKLAQLDGTVSDVALVPGEQLLRNRWVAPEDRDNSDVALPDGMQELSIALPVEHVVGGSVKAGDTVGIVVSATLKMPPDDKEIQFTEQIFHKVLVLDVQKGSTTQAKEAAAAADDATYDTIMVTLARPTDDVQKIVWGQEFGSVWLTLEPEEADESGSRAIDGGKVFTL